MSGGSEPREASRPHRSVVGSVNCEGNQNHHGMAASILGVVETAAAHLHMRVDDSIELNGRALGYILAPRGIGTVGAFPCAVSK